MFKKLKQKIEDGGESGLENISFTPTKLPGSIVRSNSPRNGKRIPSSSAPGDLAPDPATQLAEVFLESDEEVRDEEVSKGI